MLWYCIIRRHAEYENSVKLSPSTVWCRSVANTHTCGIDWLSSPVSWLERRILWLETQFLVASVWPLVVGEGLNRAEEVHSKLR